MDADNLSSTREKMKLAEQIHERIEAGAYAEALRLGAMALANDANDPHITKLMLHLTATIRSVCMGMASKKMDSGPEYLTLEALLRKANAITGEDMYGQKTSVPPPDPSRDLLRSDTPAKGSPQGAADKSGSRPVVNPTLIQFIWRWLGRRK